MEEEFFCASALSAVCVLGLIREGGPFAAPSSCGAVAVWRGAGGGGQPRRLGGWLEPPRAEGTGRAPHGRPGNGEPGEGVGGSCPVGGRRGGSGHRETPLRQWEGVPSGNGRGSAQAPGGSPQAPGKSLLRQRGAPLRHRRGVSSGTGGRSPQTPGGSPQTPGGDPFRRRGALLRHPGGLPAASVGAGGSRRWPSGGYGCIPSPVRGRSCVSLYFGWQGGVCASRRGNLQVSNAGRGTGRFQ